MDLGAVRWIQVDWGVVRWVEVDRGGLGWIEVDWGAARWIEVDWVGRGWRRRSRTTPRHRRTGAGRSGEGAGARVHRRARRAPRVAVFLS